MSRTWRNSMRMRNYVAAFCLAAAAFGCRGGGAYGHAVSYVPLSEEDDSLEGSREYDPVMARRFPEDWSKAEVSLFGVVLRREPAEGGAEGLVVSVRRLEPRNLCDSSNDDDTCRVTVGDREFGQLVIRVKLRSEDQVGEKAIGQGSLLRAVGKLDAAPSDEAMPTIRAKYYRHWPKFFYVTKASASLMRQ